MYNPQYSRNNSSYLAPFENRLMEYERRQPAGFPPSAGNNIIWVSGIEGAKAYNLPYNAAVILLDSTDAKFYLKSTDATGMPMLRTFAFSELQPQPAENPTTNGQSELYATKDEIRHLDAKLDALLSQLSSRGSEPTQNTPKTTGKHTG